MPRSKTLIKRQSFSKENLEKAVEMVMKKQQTIHGVAKLFKIPKTTLLRHFESFKESGLSSLEYKQNNDVKKVFTDAEEQLLVEFMIKDSQLLYGITLKGVRALAYQFS